MNGPAAELRPSAAGPPTKRPPRGRFKWLLPLPLVLFLLAMLGFPLIANMYYSFTNLTFENLRHPGLAGFQNYLDVLRDPSFWGALGFSLKFGVTASVIEVILGLGLALAFQPILERFKPLMALMLLPMMISPALMAIMYRLILNDFVGVIPRYLELAGFSGIDLFGPQWVFTTLIVIEVLQWTPFAFLVLYTALLSVPGEIVEAAVVDGATGLQVLGRIIFPLLVPALAITAFIRLIDSFRVFDHIYVLTGGGPGTQTTSISIYIYKRFFQENALGSAVATSVLLLAITLVPLLLLMRGTLRGSGRA